MAYEIILSNRAQQDRIEILQYWINRNKSNVFSIKLNEVFIETFESISINPNVGRKLGIKDFRIRIARDYLIVYFVEEDIVKIVTIWDGRRNPSEFKERLR